MESERSADLEAQRAGEIATRGKYKYYALLILVLTAVVNAADRGILPILAEEVKRDLQITDAQLAFLHGTAFMTLYSLLGIPAARLADRMSRTRLLAAGLALWSSCTLFGGLAGRFETLALARLGLGMGEASANPTTHSMLCDYFPVRHRARVFATYLCGLFIGGGAATAIGGYTIAAWPQHCGAFDMCHIRGWQVAFFFCGLPGLALALLVLRLREPVRGASEGAPSAPALDGRWRSSVQDLMTVVPIGATIYLWRDGGSRAALFNFAGGLLVTFVAAVLAWLTGDAVQWVAFGIGIYAIMSFCQRIAFTDPALAEVTLKTPSFRFSVLGFSMLGGLLGAVQFWMFAYAIRNLGVDARQAGLILGPIAAGGSVAGALAGSYAADMLRLRGPRGYLIWTSISLVLFSIALVAMLLSRSFATYAISAFIFTIFAYAWSGGAAAQVQDLVLPRMRSTTSAMNALSITLVTLAVGPYAVGKIGLVTGSLSYGLYSMLVLPPVALMFLMLAARTVARDQATKQRRAELAAA